MKKTGISKNGSPWMDTVHKGSFSCKVYGRRDHLPPDRVPGRTDHPGGEDSQGIYVLYTVKMYIQYMHIAHNRSPVGWKKCFISRMLHL